MPDLTFLQLLLIFTLAACVAALVSKALPSRPVRYSRMRLGEPMREEDIQEALDRR